MDHPARHFAKEVLGHVPLAAEAAQRLRRGGPVPIAGYSLARLAKVLPAWKEATLASKEGLGRGERRRLLVFGYLPWWLECACSVGLLLAAEGHEVDLAFLPYRRWTDNVLRFDAERQSAYLRSLLAALEPVIRVFPLRGGARPKLAPSLDEALQRLSRIDVQYTVMREQLDLGPAGADTSLLGLRLSRNRAVAGAALKLFGARRYDAVVVPNGAILEFGAIYHAARSVGIPAVTFEFGEQLERVWISQDAEVMRLEMASLWEARGQVPLTQTERQAVERLYRARRGARPWAHFGRQWQMGGSDGPEEARRQLDLDPRRPMVLLCTNVVGDSLSLGREIFTDGMASWLALTVQYFARRPDAQLVVRVHPGELYGTGLPSVEVVRQAVPVLPEHVKVVPPDSAINTYDLMDLAHCGLVYTSTAGLEMAMSGVPVVVCGATHYRGKGFTYEPDSEKAYLQLLDDLLRRPLREPLEPGAVECAWRYAHRFFFEFPFPFPWHIERFWDDLAARPFQQVVSRQVRARYRSTLRAMAGMEIDWQARANESEALTAALMGEG